MKIFEKTLTHIFLKHNVKNIKIKKNKKVTRTFVFEAFREVRDFFFFFFPVCMSSTTNYTIFASRVVCCGSPAIRRAVLPSREADPTHRVRVVSVNGR